VAQVRHEKGTTGGGRRSPVGVTPDRSQCTSERGDTMTTTNGLAVEVDDLVTGVPPDVRRLARELVELHDHHGAVLRSLADGGAPADFNERRHLVTYAHDVLTLAVDLDAG